MGSLTITTRQAERLAVPSHRQLSPHLENCCLRISANVSYEKATQDVDYLTGIRVPTKTQQRLVHQQTFPQPEAEVPLSELVWMVAKSASERRWAKSASGKTIKLSPPKLDWSPLIHDNGRLIDWTNQQPLASPVACLGDGHDGIWNIIGHISIPEHRREILDWYHLVENLHKVGGSLTTSPSG